LLLSRNNFANPDQSWSRNESLMPDIFCNESDQASKHYYVLTLRYLICSFAMQSNRGSSPGILKKNNFAKSQV
jgi:hypothetical protein